jgi:UDP-N-acetylglucosamine--N-acetylmuramyl-(pentapeptide) pyrophosphoryl-undecaprenol N-acetylglucosamine transferase
LGGFEGVRVYFSPCGMGLGHVGRALPVAEELVRRGAEVMFSTYLEGVEYIRRMGFPVVSSPALSLASDLTGRIDLRASAVTQGVPALPRFMQQVKKEMEYMKAFGPEVVVSDTRLSSVVAGKLLGLPVALMLNQFMPMVPRSEQNLMLSKILDGGILTLLSRGWGASDVILIPDFPEPYTISQDSLRIPKPYRHLVKMVGFILPRKPEEVEDTGRVREEAGATGGETLIYAAISGPRQEREPLIRLLRPIFEGFPSGNRVVMSMGDPEGGSNPASSGNLTAIPWVVDRYEYLKACDLVVCRGGHNTIMQSICYGKPSIIVPTPNHTEQYANARRAKELGFAEALHQKELDRDRLLEVADSLLSEPKYGERFTEISSKGFFDGIVNILSVISDLIGE